MRQTILATVLVLVIGATGLVWFRLRSTPAPAPASSLPVKERILQYQHLKALQPDLGILSDPAFRILVPAVPLATTRATTSGGQPLPTGRTNPFAPFE